MYVYSISFTAGYRPLDRAGTNSDVICPGCKHVIGHGLDAAGTIDFKWTISANHPGREDQIGVAERMIGVQMCYERVQDVGRVERGDPLLLGGRRTTYYAGAEIH